MEEVAAKAKTIADALEAKKAKAAAIVKKIEEAAAKVKIIADTLVKRAKEAAEAKKIQEAAAKARTFEAKKAKVVVDCSAVLAPEEDAQQPDDSVMAANVDLKPQDIINRTCEHKMAVPTYTVWEWKLQKNIDAKNKYLVYESIVFNNDRKFHIECCQP